MTRVLITGGAGFIGANLGRRLTADGAAVLALDDLSTGLESNLEGTSVELVVGSILDTDVVDRLVGTVDTVVHLAARPSVPRSLADPVASHVVNATGTVTVLDAARRCGQPHVIVASSSSVYGANPELPKRESAATRPLSPYAASKLATEAYTLAYGSSFGVSTLAFRFFNVFGELQPAGHAYAAVVPAFVDAALRGAPISVHGDGTQTRDFTHVETVSRTIAAAVERRIAHPEPVNLAFGTRTDLNTLLHLIADRVHRPLVIHHTDGRPGDVAHSQADPTVLRRLIPDIEPIPLATGLDRTIEWMRARTEAGRPGLTTSGRPS